MNAISYKLLVEISPILQLKCGSGQRLTGYILRYKGQRSRSQREHIHFSGGGTTIDVFFCNSHTVVSVNFSINFSRYVVKIRVTTYRRKLDDFQELRESYGNYMELRKIQGSC